MFVTARGNANWPTHKFVTETFFWGTFQGLMRQDFFQESVLIKHIFVESRKDFTS